MSIVKQIVDLSGGRIDIRSDQQSGTEVKLSLPLDNCLPKPKSVTTNGSQFPEHEDPVDAVRRRAAGRTFNIQGFTPLANESDLRAGTLASLKESMEKYSTQWFHLNPISSTDYADVSISDEAAFLHLSTTKPKSGILLVLCHNSARRELYPTITDNGQIVEFVSRPCGPHRLAKALLNCLDAEDSAPRTVPRERVSAQRAHSGGVLPDNATETACTGNTRLIGDLQSSIGFSPAVISLIKTPGLQANSDKDQIRPPITHKVSNTSTGSVTSRRSEYSGKSISVDSADIFPTSPTSILTPEGISFEPVSPDATGALSPPRQPKMLLVEVSHLSRTIVPR